MTEISMQNSNMVAVPPKKRTTMVFVVHLLTAVVASWAMVQISPRLDFGFAIIGSMLVMGLYYVPSYVAAARGHQNTVPILLVNLLFGSTGFGWIVALIWACMSVQPRYEALR